MGYASLESCLIDLERQKYLVRIKETIDPYLEMAAVHLAIQNQKGPALLFENIKNNRFRAASNIFGSIERCEFIFRDSMADVQQLIKVKQNPLAALSNLNTIKSLARTGLFAINNSSPLKKPVLYQEIKIEDLPLIQHWPLDGGAFITLPQVYSEDPEFCSTKESNLGMYRIQLNGNKYTLNQNIGLHYQLHRGIGIHHTKALKNNTKLKVSIFIGGPPAHTFAAVMPLPEGMSELNFAGILGRRNFNYTRRNGHLISTDADFVITGEINTETLPEGPFGDHLGYYSLEHPFPNLKVHKVFARKNAIWPFTVVGRPPQEDSYFGAIIHTLSGDAIKSEIPGVKQVHAVDEAGVHPLLFAIGTERYTPFNPIDAPLELLTQANRILGTGQLSLAKYLFITSDSDSPDIYDAEAFIHHILERIDFERDLHFQTKTSIDTLDYSGETLNLGSKVIIAAHGSIKRTLDIRIPEGLDSIVSILDARIVSKGIIALQIDPFKSTAIEKEKIDLLLNSLEAIDWNGIAQITLTENPRFTSKSFSNYLWEVYTRSNPSHDIYGIKSYTKEKHWACKGPMVIDARVKPHHAPALEINPTTIAKIKPLFAKGGSLSKFDLPF